MAFSEAGASDRRTASRLFSCSDEVPGSLAAADTTLVAASSAATTAIEQLISRLVYMMVSVLPWIS